MTVDRPYCRVYHSVMDDAKFDGIREDMRLFGSWTMLLLVADMAYPAPAFVPPTVPRPAFEQLARVGLVDPLSGHRYRVHGLEAERERRSNAARVGGVASGERRRNDRSTTVQQPLTDGSPSAGTKSNLAETKPRRDEPSIAPAREGLPNLNSAVAKCWEDATGRTVIGSGAYAAEYLDDACRRHPPSEVAAAIIRARKTFDHIPDAAQLVSAMRPILDPLPDRKTVVEAEDTEKRRATAKRNRLLTHHSGGHHIDAADPDCPKCQEGAA